MEAAMYYIYALIDNRTNLPFYIGKGKQENQRHLDHFKETITTTSNRHKFFKMQFLKENGYSVSITILEDNILDELTAYQIETDYIKKYGRENIDKGGILTNICLDNRPPSWKGKKQTRTHLSNRIASYMDTCKKIGRKPHSEETKKKIARHGCDNGFYGKTHSEENKQAHSKRMKGNKNNAKQYKFTDPNGITYEVKGEFAKFCIDNNLTVSTMEKSLKSSKMPLSGKCKGWKVERIEKYERKP